MNMLRIISAIPNIIKTVPTVSKTIALLGTPPVEWSRIPTTARSTPPQRRKSHFFDNEPYICGTPSV